MGRAPCCEKMGLKRGPWSPEEDQILINHIKLHGHGNWRALPKQAGLLRCGKSCRLRWTNYLRPDIKRGNFTREEEEAIIDLHEKMGNRWSAIAAKLPGRTDNEIKNVWHTHLKKRITHPPPAAADGGTTRAANMSIPCNAEEAAGKASPAWASSPQPSSSDETSNATSADDGLLMDFPMDDEFWSEVLAEDAAATDLAFPVADPFLAMELPGDCGHGGDACEGMQFWYDLLNRAEGLPDFVEF